jgi:hypothetical protein
LGWISFLALAFPENLFLIDIDPESAEQATDYGQKDDTFLATHGSWRHGIDLDLIFRDIPVFIFLLSIFEPREHFEVTVRVPVTISNIDFYWI